METPIVRCPRKDCGHPIDQHVGFESPSCDVGCNSAGCLCKMTPNLIAVANVHQVLFGDLTDPGLTSVSRNPDGSWG